MRKRGFIEKETYNTAREEEEPHQGIQHDGHQRGDEADEEGGGADSADQHAEAAREGAVARRDGAVAVDLLVDERGGQGEDGQGDEELEVVVLVSLLVTRRGYDGEGRGERQHTWRARRPKGMARCIADAATEFV